MSNKVYDVITDRIISKLENGVVPWQRPWNTTGIPKNFISDKEYRGINTFLTACQGYQSEYWITFKQCKEKKGSIKLGEKGTPVIYWNWLDRTVQDKNGIDKIDKVPFLRYYTVFNLEQTTGIDYSLPDNMRNNNQVLDNCQSIIDNMQNKPVITTNSERAYYKPSTDSVGLPSMSQFISSQDYYSVMFHELIHSTGHEKRLNREGITDLNEFGSYSYSKEELVAEMGASFLNGITGIVDNVIDNSASYIQGWLTRLKNDKKLLIHAAAQAQHAADYIQNKKVK